MHFQKVSQVVVRLLPSKEFIGSGKTFKVERNPIYTRPWFIIAAGVGAIVVGGIVGWGAGHTRCYAGNSTSNPGCQ